ncbi:hypothetical protein BGP75_19625 [Motiliproteus sp. MSK22-1]|nr:hypothetical protein BGP75_19625 [Motiliproteus sp. MSK22-1]
MNADTDVGREQLIAQLVSLREENRRLKSINKALVERVESGPSNHIGAYDSFEYSVSLAEQVRERTEALNAALAEIKQSNQALKRATNEAETAHQYLMDAIESVSDAFVLYDRDRRLLIYNSKFENFWKGSDFTIRPGMHQQQILDYSRESGLIEGYYECLNGTESWEKYSLLGDGRVFRLRSAGWVQMSEHQTNDGGLVVLYKDITALIENERALREEALAKKSRVLLSTLDNLSQGVVLVNQNNQLQIWNQRFAELINIDTGALRIGLDYTELMAQSEVVDLNPGSRDPLGLPCHDQEQQLSSGQVIEVKTHSIATGEFVNTYTDITERSLSAQALAASEHRIRLITDAVPALIAYVNKSRVYEFTNRAYESWYGWDRHAIVGSHLEEVLSTEQLAVLAPYINRALKGEAVKFEIADPTAGGVERFVVKSYVPHFDAGGEVQGFYVLVQDITEQRLISEELKSAYQHLELRVEERTAELQAVNKQLKALNRQLLQAKKEAEQANYSKTKFLAAASHDLLQPMNAARLFSASLLEQPLKDKPRKLVDALSFSLEDMESLLVSLVDISKLDAGVVKPDLLAFQAQDLLSNLANEYATLANDYDIEFDFVPSSAVIHTDSQLLARILRNFLSNAFRYTSQGKVLLGCRRRQGFLSIQVWDTGIGIDQSKLGAIFEEFNRLPQDEIQKLKPNRVKQSNGYSPSGRPQIDKSQRDKGLGLGLAIVDKMAGVLKHQIMVRSEPGKGSCFSVEVPYGRVSPIASSPGNPPGTVQPGAEELYGCRVLVLDNDPSICEAMATLMAGWGCQVTTALNVDEIVCGNLAATADLIIADYHLDNGQNGIDAVAYLERELLLSVPVLMITANYSNELKQQVRARGYRLLNKPVRPAKLKAVVHHLLSPKSSADR